MTDKVVFEKSYNEALELFKLHRNWVTAVLSPEMPWPNQLQLIHYQKQDLLLVPETNDQFRSVSSQFTKSTSYEVVADIILQFLSALSWAYDSPIQVESWHGPGLPYGAKCLPNSFRYHTVMTSKIQPDLIPVPPSDEARRALGYYREALALKKNHAGYSFLSFFKIINLVYGRGSDQKSFIKRNVSKISRKQTAQRIAEIQTNPSIPIEEYLYENGRCAIAHSGANNQPYFDPENFKDIVRIGKDIPVIKELCEILIRDHFGIVTPRSLNFFLS